MNIRTTTLSLAITATLPGGVLAQQPQSDENIERLTVQGRAAQFYFVGESTMATKTPTDYMDIPQSIQVLSRELIEDQAARQTTDLYRSISGITQFSYSGITARGFRQDQVRYDGVQGDPYGGFSIPQLFNIEQVEVLKGPSGMLYGGGQPGGLLNYVTKKPRFESAHELALFGGNYDLKGAYGDSTGSLNEEQSLAYRLGGFYQHTQPYRNNTDETNLLLSAGLSWMASDATQLSLQYDFIDQDLGGHRLRGVPVDDDGNFLTDISYNPNEKTDFQRVEADVWQAILQHEFSPNFTNRTVLRYLDNERGQNYHENRGLQSDGRSMIREFRDQVRENQELSLTTDFVYQTNWGGLEHTLLVGGDYFEVDSHFEYKVGRGAAANIPDIDIFDPQYGSDPSTYILQQRPDSDTSYNRTGLYVQDQINLTQKWIAVLGARYDHFEDKDLNSEYAFSDSDISPRLGLIYKPSENTSIFASRSEGFEPQSLSAQLSEDSDVDSGDALEPEQSRQYELGIKHRWLDGRLLSTATVYQISKQNVAVGNPDDSGEGDGQPGILQIGEVTSEGFELDLVGDLAQNWTATLSYAYNQAKITGGAPGAITNSVGDEFVNAPDHTLGLWSRYDFPELDSAFSLGMDYVSERISFDGQKVQPYTVWDASWRSHIGDFDLQVNIKNLFDKEYASSGFSKRNGHFPGEPRTFLVQLSRSF
ncbi:TonB-dependent siderophore receptor [Bowmanella dokdonensis]|uniref:TonB-dependent receptor n=1 Tax=Bowmanella dokdonensis TaxID=751969 RepID=A0A939DL59_9ALTE|nr:TonB-dependent receptor [Bowmanella dokdonensis]MBN7823881.1 TonB-dependent receptor [Bowmanella dokdonensis]